MATTVTFEEPVDEAEDEPVEEDEPDEVVDEAELEPELEDELDEVEEIVTPALLQVSAKAVLAACWSLPHSLAI